METRPGYVVICVYLRLVKENAIGFYEATMFDFFGLPVSKAVKAYLIRGRAAERVREKLKNCFFMATIVTLRKQLWQEKERDYE
jgi:hypothetical protein